MSSGKAIASMVLGIISIVFCVAGYIPLIIGILAIILAGISLNNDEAKGMATTGLVTGIIGSVFSFIYLVIWVAIVSI